MLSAFRLTLSFLSGRQKLVYWMLVILRALTGLLDVVGIALIGFVAAAAVRLGSPGTPLRIAGLTIPEVTSQGLLVLVIVVLSVFIVKASLAIFLTWRLTHFVATLESENAYVIANHLLRGSLDSVKRYSKAEFQYSITASTTYAFTGILNNVATFCSEGFLLVVVAATFFVVNPVAAVFALAYFGLILLLIQGVIGRSLKRAGRDAVEGTVTTVNAVSDTIDTFREIAVLHKQDLFIQRIRLARARISRSDATMTFLSGMPRYVVETALILGVVIFVAQQFLTGQLATSFGTIGVFLTGGVRMMASLLPLQNAASAMKQNVEQAELSQRLLVEARGAEHLREAEPDLDSAVLERLATDEGFSIRIDRASYRYPGDVHDTLHGITLQVVAGEHVAIIGPSGAGKTTLVDLMLGLIRPDSGSVEISGIEPTALRRVRPGAVSYVPQKPGMVSGTIAENIALGVEPADIDRELLEEVVSDAYLREFIETLPDGLHTSVGKQVDSLSGGQIQRIGLARALYARPRLLILDEATSGLDAGSEAFVSDTLSRMQGKVTVVVIAHRLSTVQHSDIVHVVQEGRVVASDKFKKLQATVPMVAEYVKLMSFDEMDAPDDHAN
jgi:ABC-type multidrug transport system fused ATPase/permease subunit